MFFLLLHPNLEEGLSNFNNFLYKYFWHN